VTEQTNEQPIPDEAKFLSALGVNPGNVVAGTIRTEWANGTPVVSFTSVYAVTPQQLGLAFLAAAPMEEHTGPKQPEDRKPAKKAAAKKATPARKRAEKGEGGGGD
jgi:hypothetical protein